MMNIFNDLVNSDFAYMISCMGEEVYIDNQKVKSWVQNGEVTNGYYERVILAERSFNRGSIIDYREDRYIILSDTRERKYNKYHKGIMRLVNELIYFELEEEHYFFPCAIETEGMSLKTFNGGVLTLADGNMVVNLQRNQLTKKIMVGKTFWGMQWGWEVVGIDRSFEGLIKLHCQKTTVADDVKNPPVDTMEYPSRPNYNGGVEPIDPVKPELPEEPVHYEISIEGVNQIEVGRTSQFNAVVKADGEVVTDKEFVWEVKRLNGTSSLSTINEDGLLQAGSGKEDVIITVKLLDNYSIYSEKQVEIFDNGDWGW